MLIHTHSVMSLFRELFLDAHSIEKPVIELDRIVHWKAHMRMIGRVESKLSKRKALFFGGYLYNFSTPPIGAEEITQAIEYGRENGAEIVVVPTVRDVDDCGGLEDAHFKRVPCFIESVVEIDGAVFDDVRARIGGKRYREMLRRDRAVSDEYEMSLYKGSELRENDELVQLVADLHNENIKKYSYPTNFYSKSVIKRLSESSLADGVIVGIRSRRSDSYPVQVFIWLFSRERSELYSLVQGIRHEDVPRKHNLYVAAKCDLYRFAESKNVKKIYCGRGNQLEKYRLGANKFYLLNHWIYSEDKDLLAEAETISERTRACMELDNLPFEIIQRETSR